MAQADDIRDYAYRNYIAPARARGERLIIMRAGDVSAGTGVREASAVCCALGSDMFEEKCGVRRVYLHGPIPGMNTYFVFDLKP